MDKTIGLADQWKTWDKPETCLKTISMFCVCVFLYSSGADITSSLIMAFFFEIWKLNSIFTSKCFWLFCMLYGRNIPVYPGNFICIICIICIETKRCWREGESDRGSGRERGEGVTWIERGADGLSFQSCSLFSSERLMFSDSTHDNQQGTTMYKSVLLLSCPSVWLLT